MTHSLTKSILSPLVQKDQEYRAFVRDQRTQETYGVSVVAPTIAVAASEITRLITLNDRTNGPMRPEETFSVLILYMEGPYAVIDMNYNKLPSFEDAFPRP